jgi:hypothetical protein
MTKNLKELRKDMKQEPRVVTDTRVAGQYILMLFVF